VVPGAEWADPARRSLAQRPRPAPASAPLCSSPDAAASWFGSSEAWARAPTQLLAPSLEEEAALFRALDVVDDLPLPARWHARGDAAYALPASVKTELDACVATGVFAAEQLDDDAVATLVRSRFRAPLACVQRSAFALRARAQQAHAGAELALLVLGQLDGSEQEALSAAIHQHARQLAQLVAPTGGAGGAAPETMPPPPSPPLPQPSYAPPPPSEAPLQWSWLPPPPDTAALVLPPPAAPQAPHVAPPPPNPRVRELTEELARAKVAHATTVAELHASLHSAQEQLAQLRAACAQQQQRLAAAGIAAS
jgi:hypothetical protein